jgi:glycosyltransferase involved in cell wall biosynthesis
MARSRLRSQESNIVKVLVVSRGVKPVGARAAGGAELVMWRLAEQAAAQGAEVHVVSDVAPGAEIKGAASVRPVGAPEILAKRLRSSGFYYWILLHLLGNFMAFLKAWRLMRSQEVPFDVIHCHGNLSGLLLSFVKGKTALIYTEHDSTPWSCRYPGKIESAVRKLLYTLLDARLFRRADLSIVLYEAQRLEIMRRWGVAESRIDVLPNGVDTSTFSPAPVAPGQAPALSSGYCLFVGRLERRKGVSTLIKAMARCDERCVIVGDGPDRAQLEEMAKALRIDDRVVFEGAKDNSLLPGYYRDARMFILPSHSEAFPLSLLESMACGTPFIATRVGANEDMVTTTSAGLLFDAGDEAALAERIQALVSRPDEAAEMARKGRAAIESVFSWPKVGERLKVAYARFAAAPAPTIAPASPAMPALREGIAVSAPVQAPAAPVVFNSVSLATREVESSRTR